ncbi:MAG: methyltransferase domain-containing protein [Planctomycetes bacterium]|nr:methyltransferase domain-containing protein [Planctomycetota bacterium]
MTDVLELPFDQYQRYKLTADLLETLRAPKERLSVLDVGGRTALLRSFLPQDDVQLVDVEASAERGLVLGSGAALPFKDASFDAVCAFDTLEHVPPPLRRAFVRECARVAKRWVLLAGPYEAPRVVAAEEHLQRFLREKLKTEHRYLNEHRGHGLPVRAEVEAELAGLGARVASFGHANLERWLVGMCMSMYLDDDPALRGLAKHFHRYYNRELFRSDHADDVYRHVVVGALRGASLPRDPAASGALDAPAAPRGALAPFAALLEELAAFDRERDAWRDEREKLKRVARDLEHDLTGHKKSLAERVATNEEQARVIGDLRDDLDGHRRSLAELGAARAAEAQDFAAVRAELEAELGRQREALEAAAEQARRMDVHVADLENLLASRALELEGVQRERAAAEAELARLRAYSQELEAALHRANESAARLNQELVATLARLDDTGRTLTHTRGELDAARAENAALRTELRSRWKNLKRGLNPKKPRY